MIDLEQEVAQLTRIHAELILRKGGVEGGPKAGCMEAAVGSAEQSAGYFDEDGGANLLVLPAFALVYVARRHCYPDGNKRVAWAAFTRFLA